jgi:hypothetical protein
MSDAHFIGELTLLDALIALADPAKWLRYCELLAEIRDGMSQLGQGSPAIFGPQHQDYTSYGRSRLRWVYATSTERQQLAQWDSWATRVPNGAALIDEVHRLDDELVTVFREAAGAGRLAATRGFGTARQPFDPSLIERRDHELRLDVDVIRPPDGHIISGVRIRILYFS